MALRLPRGRVDHVPWHPKLGQGWRRGAIPPLSQYLGTDGVWATAVAVADALSGGQAGVQSHLEHFDSKHMFGSQ